MVDILVSRIVHLVFAALWAGSVCYVAFVVLPLARDGAFNTTKPLEVMSGKLTTLSRASAVVLFLSGGHLAGTTYTVGDGAGPGLFTSTNGQLVLAMVALWLALAVLVEVGSKRLRTGLDGKKLREPAHEALPVFRAAGVVAIGLLVVAGTISGGLVRFV
ncbi:copper resistance protein CopD [Natronobiforma cellulositropha]|uniref:copper resistance protein CopD n=1 Tax=Natronobiforma cellulositropha TaxID=1679076 RepID=UPI0021D572D0|nr:copper resistance protein CopD [Natronobiforma cellulositropha]